MIKLLLVEDDASLRYIVQGGLEDMIGGYEVIVAANGEEGLKQWKEQHPDVIVSDIEMPVMNGYEMVKRIRETDGETPILFSSALISPKDVVKGYEIGANNYIKKPFIPEELGCTCPRLIEAFQRRKIERHESMLQDRQGICVGCHTCHFETCFGCKQDFDCARDRFVADAL